MQTHPPRAFATQLFISALAVLGTGGGLGFAIVDLRHDISISANNIRMIEQRIADTERRGAEVGGFIAGEQTPEHLAYRNQALGLGLVAPTEARVVRVSGSVEQRLATKRNAEIFAAENGQVIVPVRYQVGGAPR
jgi:hypothetical protein